MRTESSIVRLVQTTHEIKNPNCDEHVLCGIARFERGVNTSSSFFATFNNTSELCFGHPRNHETKESAEKWTENIQSYIPSRQVRRGGNATRLQKQSLCL